MALWSSTTRYGPPFTFAAAIRIRSLFWGMGRRPTKRAPRSRLSFNVLQLTVLRLSGPVLTPTKTVSVVGIRHQPHTYPLSSAGLRQFTTAMTANYGEGRLTSYREFSLQADVFNASFVRSNSVLWVFLKDFSIAAVGGRSDCMLIHY